MKLLPSEKLELSILEFTRIDGTERWRATTLPALSVSVNCQDWNAISDALVRLHDRRVLSNFDIPSFLDHALTACRAKTGAFVGPPGTTVALDDVETDLCRADFGGSGLDRRHQRMRCASTPESRVHPHRHQVNYGEVMWIAAAGHEPPRFVPCF